MTLKWKCLSGLHMISGGTDPFVDIALRCSVSLTSRSLGASLSTAAGITPR